MHPEKPRVNFSKAVLERYYLEQEDIPPELFLSDEMSTAEVIQTWLEKKSGHPVEVQCPKSGEKSKLIALVRTNAQFWLDEFQLMKLKRGDMVPHSINALQRTSFTRTAAENRMLRYFEHPGIGHRRFVVVFTEWQTEEKRVPKV